VGTEETKELARRYFEAGDQDRLDLWDEICGPEMTVLPGFTPPIEGLEAVKGFTAGFHRAFSPFYLRIEDVIAEGDRAAVRWSTGGTHSGPMLTPNGELPATGKAVSMAGISIVRVANGKLVEERVQADIMGLMQQLGLIPAPESTRG
jgi:predicted ester cyclase